MYVGILFQKVPNDSWRVTRINETYELADTYPAIVRIIVWQPHIHNSHICVEGINQILVLVP